jgi:NAD(P)-dependent dehydrogenase (short-subunit alcohol dehydrogenase family)
LVTGGGTGIGRAVALDLARCGADTVICGRRPEPSEKAAGWVIRIPEIGGVTRASRRVAVEVVARKYIAARTGIPIRYITVVVRN